MKIKYKAAYPSSSNFLKIPAAPEEGWMTWTIFKEWHGQFSREGNLPCAPSPSCPQHSCVTPLSPMCEFQQNIVKATFPSLLGVPAVKHHFESWLITTCLTTTTVFYSYQMEAAQSTPWQLFSTCLLELYSPENQPKKVFGSCRLSAFHFTSNRLLTHSRQI